MKRHKGYRRAPAIFLAQTTRAPFTLEEIGAYALLSDWMLSDHAMPATDEICRRVTRADTRVWRRIRARLEAEGLLGWLDGHAILLEPPVQPGRTPLPQSIRAAVFERDGGLCRYCRTVLTIDDPASLTHYHCDHVVPVASGGTDGLSNLAAACSACNRSKAARSVEEWQA